MNLRGTGRRRSSLVFFYALVLDVIKSLSQQSALLCFGAGFVGQVESNGVDAFVADHWRVIQQVVPTEYSYQPASAYSGACLGALRVGYKQVLWVVVVDGWHRRTARQLQAAVARWLCLPYVPHQCV